MREILILLLLVLCSSFVNGIISLEVNPPSPIYKNKDDTITADWSLTGEYYFLNHVFIQNATINNTEIINSSQFNTTEFCIGSECYTSFNGTFLQLDGSNQPDWTPTTTKVTNLNADLLDGYSVGTSGSAIPILSGGNTWSNSQTLSTSYKLILRNSKLYINSPAANTAQLKAEGNDFTNIGKAWVLGNSEAIIGLSSTTTYVKAIGNPSSIPYTPIIEIAAADGAIGENGGYISVQAGAGGTLAVDGYFVINDAGKDVDSWIEGNTDSDLVYVNAGTDRVGIGTNSPSYKLDVDGTFRATDYYSGDGTQGITDSNSYWLCAASDCSSSCQVDIKDGLIVGCT